jgi:uncharacterized protein YjiS (DUF1127 family)
LLKQLEPHRLADIGISPKQAALDAKKPIWDVPARWRT